MSRVVSVEFTPFEAVVPGPGLPDDLDLLPANNNLDIVEHDGRLFFAFRTGLVHFATPFTRMYVLVSDDGGASWTLETKVDRGRDIREPRLLSWNGRLFFYFFEAGVNPLDFRPGRIFASERRSSRTWTEPVPITDEGYAVWRTKVVDGVPYMTRYRGGESIYDFSGNPIDVEFLTTDDGFAWTPVDAEHPVAYRGGGSEADFAFAEDGTLFAVVRNEHGDDTGWGSLICTAPVEALGDWSGTPDKRKYDSPLVFKQDGEIYLIARRQIANDGAFDLGLRRLPTTVQSLLYEAVYWVTRKRTALWHLDQDSRRIEWILDFPSRGDTAFPAVVRLDDRRLLLYNYSSPIDGWDKPWVLGQLTPTQIYATVLTFPEREG